MYQATVKVGELKKGELVLKTENRNLMRSLTMLCNENRLECKVTVETKPREVKFKGVD